MQWNFIKVSHQRSWLSDQFPTINESNTFLRCWIFEIPKCVLTSISCRPLQLYNLYWNCYKNITFSKLNFYRVNSVTVASSQPKQLISIKFNKLSTRRILPPKNFLEHIGLYKISRFYFFLFQLYFVNPKLLGRHL